MIWKNQFANQKKKKEKIDFLGKRKTIPENLQTIKEKKIEKMLQKKKKFKKKKYCFNIHW